MLAKSSRLNLETLKTDDKINRLASLFDVKPVSWIETRCGVIIVFTDTVSERSQESSLLRSVGDVDAT
jgi:hypothetical protein